MIQIYNANNTNFDNHGDMVLMPIDCEVSPEIGGAWTLSLSHPIDAEGRWKYIQNGAVIKAPSWNGEQLFRIISTSKKDSGIVAEAEPIGMDIIGEVFLMDSRAVMRTGQQALDIILEGSRFTGESDILTLNTAYFVRMNAMEAIAGESDNSFVNRWGGELGFNNFTISMNKRLGHDNGVQVLYGKNIPTDGISETVDTSEVVTRIVPQAFNGRLMTGTSHVDSPLINAYPTIHTKLIEYEDVILRADLEGDDEEGKTVCETQTQLNKALKERAEEEFKNGIDKPTVTISIEMVLLENTAEYKDFKKLEQIHLGDTIHCNHSRLGIVTDARVVSLTYDCIREIVTSVTIGSVARNIMDNISSAMSASEKAIKKDGTILAERIEGIINSMKTQLRLQNTIAERQEVRAILFEDLDPESKLYGAMSLGTQGFQIANKRLEDDSDWDWTTFGTAQGFSADLIVAGVLNAITITGSTLISEWSNGNTGIQIQGGRVHIHSKADGKRRGVLEGTASSDATSQNIALIADSGNSVYLGVVDEDDGNVSYPFVDVDGGRNRVTLWTKHPTEDVTLPRFRANGTNGLTYLYGIYQNKAYANFVCGGSSRSALIYTPDGSDGTNLHLWADGANYRTYVYEPVLSGTIRISDGETVRRGLTTTIPADRSLIVQGGIIIGYQ